MAFTLSNFSRQTVALNTGQVDINGDKTGGPATFSYRSDTDDLATITAANYFLPVIYELNLSDLITIVSSDNEKDYYVSAIDRDAGTISLEALTLSGLVDGSDVADYAPDDPTATLPIMYQYRTPGGSTGTVDYSFNVNQKMTVTDVWVINRETGTAGDTIRVMDQGILPISTLLDVSGAVNSVTRTTGIDINNNVELNNFKIQQIDGGGQDCPSCDVFIFGIKTA